MGRALALARHERDRALRALDAGNTSDARGQGRGPGRKAAVALFGDLPDDLRPLHRPEDRLSALCPLLVHAPRRRRGPALPSPHLPEGVVEPYPERLAGYIAGLNSAKTAPWGSLTTEKRPVLGMSVGGTIGEPPSCFAFVVEASTSSTMK